MSFSSEVKKELIRHYTKAEHCQRAELAAMVLFQGKPAAGQVRLSFEDEELARKCAAQFKKVTGLTGQAWQEAGGTHRKKSLFYLDLAQSALQEAGIPFPQACGRNGEDGAAENQMQALLSRLLKKPCCRRAFLRAAFVASGMISDPEKHYHFEILCADAQTAAFLQELTDSFQISARQSKRRERFVVYIKEGVEIADMLNVMEAHVALMEFENIRIVREMRGNVNRKVNCETANIGKTVTAAMKQIEDIHYLKETIGFDELDGSLKEIAKIRLDHPDTPLSRLGELLDPPLGKSGVNHRLRKLSSLADELRKQSGSLYENAQS